MPAPDPLATTRLGGAHRASSAGPPPCGVSQGDLLGGRFYLGAPIGWGGQAVVFHAVAVDRRGHRTPLALKVIRTDLPAADRREAADLLRWEASLLRRLRHASLPRLTHFASDAKGAWLARELVDGAPLSALLRHGPLEPRRVQSIAAQLCMLLRYLHTRAPAVICGDIKPANLILRPDGTIALIDLGAAQTRTRRPPRGARPRHGTAGYASPEQLGGRGIDERSDLFSLAATCYELLTGRDPALTPLVFDLERLAAASPGLARALTPALSPDPAARPPTAAALHASVVRIPGSPALALAPGVFVTTRQELGAAAHRHPRELQRAIELGVADTWLADHQDPALGRLVHRLREERRAAPRAAPLDQLLAAMAAPAGSALLAPGAHQISFGDVPLRQLRAWGAPRRLTISNADSEPQRWELECPPQPDADVRVLVGGRPAKKAGGLLPPGGRIELELVVAGKAGPLRGSLALRCGQHTTAVPWEATARAGLPVGHRIVARLADLDPAQPGLVAALDDLARRGALQRWLRGQRLKDEAERLDAALTSGDALALRLQVAALLSPLSPARFPLLALVDAPAPVRVLAGTRATTSFVLENRGATPLLARAAPACAWAQCALSPAVTPPGGRCMISVSLAPPADLAPGTHVATVVVRAGDLDIPLAATVEVSPSAWWQRALRWIGG